MTDQANFAPAEPLCDAAPALAHRAVTASPTAAAPTARPPMSAAQRADAYLAKVPTAISGSAGHSTTFAAACRLVEFGLLWHEAWPLFLEWNSRCQPPWSEAELHHKLADAYRRAKPRPEFVQRSARRAHWHPSIPPSPRPATCPVPAQITQMRQMRPKIPPTDTGFPDEHAHLAKLRGISSEGVSLAAQRGLVRFGMFRWVRSWIIADKSGRVAQARRLDGEPWGPDVKAWTIGRSQARWPVGIEEAAKYKSIALVEGGPDLLAAHHFIVRAGRTKQAAAVAILGGMSIHEDALPLFVGKCVRIYAQSDEPGERAALRWQEQLNAAGAVAEVYWLRSRFRGVKDLNDLARLNPDAFRESIFP